MSTSRGQSSISRTLRTIFHPFLLPVKLMFFFQLGSGACLAPFMSVFIRDLGLNAAEMGVIYGITPFLAIISKPFTGSVTDRYRQPYKLLQILFAVSTLFTLAIYFIPPITVLPINSINCSSAELSSQEAADCLIQQTALRQGHNPVRVSDTGVIRSTEQFWLISLFLTITTLVYGAVVIIDDAITVKLVAQSPVPSSYGENRAFATIGWALFALAVGVVTNQSVGDASKRAYSSAFILYGVLAAVGLLTTFFLPPLLTPIKPPLPTKDAVLGAFLTASVLLFSFGTFVIGVCAGVMGGYFQWYQAELGASNFLLGFTVFVQSCYEAPMMALSDRFIRKFGYHFCVLISITSFGIRFVGYSLVDNPWLMLPIDVFHAFGYGLFYTTMTSFAYAKAPVGNGGVLQGIMLAIFEGLGMAVGGLVAGFLYEDLGGKATWLLFGKSTFVAAILYGAGSHLCSRFSLR